MDCVRQLKVWHWDGNKNYIWLDTDGSLLHCSCCRQNTVLKPLEIGTEPHTGNYLVEEHQGENNTNWTTTIISLGSLFLLFICCLLIPTSPTITLQTLNGISVRKQLFTSTMGLALVVALTRVTNVAKSVCECGESWWHVKRVRVGESTPATNSSLQPQLNKAHAQQKQHTLTEN